MKNKFLIAIFFSIFLLVTSNVKAANFTDNQTVDSNKTWTIKFTGEVGSDNGNVQGITVTDSKGVTIPVGIQLGQDNKTVTVIAPQVGYTPGESYILNLGNKVHSNKGNALKNKYELHFNIKSNDTDTTSSESNNTAPAYEKLSLKKGNSIELTNTNNKEGYVYLDYESIAEAQCDYVVYNPDGSIFVEDHNSNFKSILVPLGCKLVLTLNSNCTVTCKGEYFNLTNKPAYKRLDLEKGNSIELTNNSNHKESVYLDYESVTEAQCDYVMYNPDGSIFVENYSSDLKSISVPSGCKLVLTLNGNCTVICNDKCFNLTTNTNPAYKRLNLEKGNSIELTNNSKRQEYVYLDYESVTEAQCDYALYKSDGSICLGEYNWEGRKLSVPSGYKLVLTLNGNCTAICNDKCFNLTNNTDPAFKRLNLEKGNSIGLANNSKEDQYVYLDYESVTEAQCSYVVYRPDGATYSEAQNTYTNFISVPSGCKLALTLNGNCTVICNNKCFNLTN